MYRQPQITVGRGKFLSVLAFLIAGIFCFRLFDLQITQGAHYKAMAQGQQQFERIQIAHRGEIFVHDSAYDPNQYYPLAFDVKKFSVLAVPKQISDKMRFAKELAPLVEANELEIYNKVNNDKVYIPPLKKGLVLEQAEAIDNKNLPGLYLVPEYSRFYPEGPMASHVLGFVNTDGDGNYGFEGKFNDVLKGREGSITGEKDTLGRVISLLSQKEPENGTSYVLTIDRGVQYFVEKKLAEGIQKYGAESGNVIIMDVKTGGILAMANYPSYDPNNFRQVATESQRSFINPSISDTYEPGSTMKGLVMATAIDNNVVTPETKGVFGESVQIGEYTIRTAERKAFGEETMTQVLENSDNVAMVWLSELMGKELMYKYIKDFGLMEKTGILLDGEVMGRVPTLKEWRDINRATISFGQGISVTPIQLVAAYTAFANKGVIIKPQIVDKTIYANGNVKKNEIEYGSRVVSEKTAATMLQMLQSVSENGSARKARVPGFNIAAKSGTAQIPDPNGGYDEKTSIHSVMGIAPVEDPRFVMLVKLDKPTSWAFSSGTASPLFGEIASFLLNYYYRLTPNM